MVAVLLPTREKVDPVQEAKQGLDTMIPSLTFREMDIKSVLSSPDRPFGSDPVMNFLYP